MQKGLDELEVKIGKLESDLGDMDTKQETAVKEIHHQNNTIQDQLVTKVEQQIMVVDTGVKERLKELEDQMSQMDRDTKEKLREKDEVDSSKAQLQEDQVRTQKDTLLILEKRLDTNENHVQLLISTDEEQNVNINTLDAKNKDLEQKIKELEAADTFLREANQEVMKKAQNIEEEEKKLSMSIVVVGDNVKEIQGNINITNENFRKQIIELKDEDEAIWKKIGDLNDDFGKVDIKIENCLLYTSPSPRDS